jgi:hypothetical protein
MKRLLQLSLLVVISLFLSSCYHDIKEKIQCPRFSLPDSIKAKGIGVYYDKRIDIDWLEKEIPRDKVESYLQTAIPEHIADAKLSATEKKALIEKSLIQAIDQWYVYKLQLREDDVICNYRKAWWQSGTTAGVVILRGCTIIGDIHFPEIKEK